MMPGTNYPILDAERLAALIGDAVDGLESFQAMHPFPGIEEVADTLRFVRRELLSQLPEALGYESEVA
jgi:hypothetical protein